MDQKTSPSPRLGPFSPQHRPGMAEQFALTQRGMGCVPNSILTTIHLVLSLLFAATVTTGAVAQSADMWPARPVKFIVPFPAGGSTDTVARLIGQMLSVRLGQQFVVENRTGASGNIGTEAVARAAPDGYTIGLASTTTHVLVPAFTRNLPFDPLKDFAPVSMLAVHPL